MRIAIVGPTGCGKTTFINLLMRFYDVDEGNIGGRKRHPGSIPTCASEAAMVWCCRIPGSRAEPSEKISALENRMQQMKKSSVQQKKQKAGNLSERLPKGLDTVLHEDSISQGQKQLLCITRVMLCLPPMLILDEATSSIDTRTELQIQEAFDKLMKGRTSFIVAHRLSTIRNASLILVMKDGKIIEQGNHEELLKKGGFYHKLYHSQFES